MCPYCRRDSDDSATVGQWWICGWCGNSFTLEDDQPRQPTDDELHEMLVVPEVQTQLQTIRGRISGWTTRR